MTQKIREEIERRYKEYCLTEIRAWEEKDKGNALFYQGQKMLCVELLSFLDTLQEPSCDTCTNDKGCVTCMYGELWEGKEQEPEVDLEKEMDEYFENMAVQEHENIFVDTYHNIARHFAQWGAEHSGSSEIPNDLQKYASRAGFDYVDDIEVDDPGHRWNDHDVEYAYRDGIIAGAKWQKEQDDRLVDIIYQQGIEKGKDEMRKTLKRKEK